MAQVYDSVAGLMRAVNGSVKVGGDGVTVNDQSAVRGELMDTLAWNAAFGENGVAEAARYLIRAIGLELGVFPASIHDYYMAAGRGEITHSTVPACNIRGMVYDCVRAASRAAASINAKAVIFEIARSELGYTGQGPAEYAARGDRRAYPRGLYRPRVRAGRPCAGKRQSVRREPGQGNQPRCTSSSRTRSRRAFTTSTSTPLRS